MKKHIELLGILHIVYHSISLIIAIVFLGLNGGDIVVSWRDVAVREIAMVIIVYQFLTFGLLSLVFVSSILGIIGGIALLKTRPWGRILVLIIGFLWLIRIPFGAALGIYTIWALMNDETIKLFEQAGKEGGVS